MMNLKEIHRLVAQFSVEELEMCFMDELDNGQSSCSVGTEDGEDDDNATRNIAQAQAIRFLMDEGLNEEEAIQALNARIQAANRKKDADGA